MSTASMFSSSNCALYGKHPEATPSRRLGKAQSTPVRPTSTAAPAGAPAVGREDGRGGNRNQWFDWRGSRSHGEYGRMHLASSSQPPVLGRKFASSLALSCSAAPSPEETSSSASTMCCRHSQAWCDAARPGGASNGTRLQDRQMGDQGYASRAMQRKLRHCRAM